MIYTEYIQKLKGILDRIATEQPVNIGRAGAAIADSIQNGGVVHTFGTGHSPIIAEEAFFRAGGIAAINPILEERLIFLKGALESTRAEREGGLARSLIEKEDIGSGDVAIVISNSGRNAVPVEMALELKNRNVFVIAITNIEQSRNSEPRNISGKHLFEIADVSIDNCVPSGDALMLLPGMHSKMAPSSTVAGSAIVHSLMLEAVSELLKRGVTPPILESANLDVTTADALRDALRGYRDRIRYLDLETEID